MLSHSRVRKAVARFPQRLEDELALRAWDQLVKASPRGMLYRLEMQLHSLAVSQERVAECLAALKAPALNDHDREALLGELLAHRAVVVASMEGVRDIRLSLSAPAPVSVL